MPSNKNALTRYMFLDEMLSDRHHFYDINDLTEICNERLVTAGLPEVTRRCIEKDIKYLEYDPFFAEIERFRVEGKRCVKYLDPSFSIFHKQLTEEESNLILEVLNTIGQFEGLVHFDWLDRLKTGLRLKERPKIISFSNTALLQRFSIIEDGALNVLGILSEPRWTMLKCRNDFLQERNVLPILNAPQPGSIFFDRVSMPIALGEYACYSPKKIGE